MCIYHLILIPISHALLWLAPSFHDSSQTKHLQNFASANPSTWNVLPDKCIAPIFTSFTCLLHLFKAPFKAVLLSSEHSLSLYSTYYSLQFMTIKLFCPFPREKNLIWLFHWFQCYWVSESDLPPTQSFWKKPLLTPFKDILPCSLANQPNHPFPGTG